jgi:small subunit ribosomal protein S16
MLIIRFQRVGKKNQASFRIVLAEKQKSAKKKFIENLGHYNPRTKDFAIPKPERLQYWVGQHVQISPSVNNLLVTKGLLKGEKVKAWKPKRKPLTKTDSTQTATDKKAGTEATSAVEEPAPAEPKQEAVKGEEPKTEPAAQA